MVNGNWTLFFAAVAGIGTLGYLVYAIFTSPKETITEAQKYFVLTVLIFIVFYTYLELVFKRKILEEKKKEPTTKIVSR
jgi:uncharacterized membrane protein (DUF2068 family)